jgi:DNA-binding MarR family transcriptional regulator
MKSPASRHQRFRASAEEAVYVDMMRTADLLSRRLAGVLKNEELSSAQYNVLRILRGAPDGLSCGDIADRMISHDPDITRLLDRLEKRSLIQRARDTKDRRMVLTHITREGLQTLARLDEPIQQAHRKLLGHMGKERLGRLTALLRLAGEKAA